MNKKKRKRSQSARRETRAVKAKKRQKVKKEKLETFSPPWLRIVSNGIEGDASSEPSRGFFSQRNGRRRPQDLDLYIPENNSRNRSE
jgi:hypothetical protein